ncbi:MAG: hypothetical protein GJ676_15060 [Rhodobacteraceae bacterium]|nr:hypothetical protein [Paracoccaceae bacterium]
MEKPSDLDVAKLFSLCLEKMHGLGLDLVQTTDFIGAEARARAMGKPSVTPMLSSSLNDFSKDDAFWLFLQRNGRDIGCVASRRDNLYSETLSEYWTRTQRRYYGLSEAEASRFHAPAALHEIRGNVVYLGEFFISDASRGSRNQLALFTHALHSYTHLKWKPDWLYAFVRANDNRRGYGVEYGFNRHIPLAQNWPNPPRGRQCGEYLTAISSDEIFHMAAGYWRNPDLLLCDDSLTKVEKLRT